MKNLYFILLLISSNLIAQTETSLSKGRKAYQEENYSEAIKLFEQAAAEEPNNAQVPYLMGRAYMDMSNYTKSAELMQRAIAMDSTRSNWIYELSLVYYAIPDYKKSLEYMLLAGEKGYKKTNDYLENLGNAYANVKQYDKAAGLYSEVLKRKPNDKELLYQTAQAYYNAGKYQEAIDNWDVLFGLDKTDAEILYMIGIAYQKKGDKEKGQQLCDKAIDMNPSLKNRRQQMMMGNF
ncbi:MAG: tetratricopeptide repeat protein [Chitinophagaceae bacterium]|nr:tetratricopeptide repeat protein [Chitinophagaceae bacterium]